MKALDNIKISSKISLNSGLILLLLVITAGVAVLGLSRAQDSFDDYSALANQSNAAGRIESLLLSARVRVNHFVATSDPDSARIADERITMAEKAASESVALFADPAKQAKVEALAAEMLALGRAFDEIVPLQQRRREIADRMEQTADEASAALERIAAREDQRGNADAAIAANGLEADLLRVEVAANKFLRRNTEERAARFAELMQVASKAQDGLRAMLKDDEAAAQADTFKRLVDSFSADFTSLAEILRQRDELANTELAQRGREIQRQLEEFRQANISEQAMLDDSATADMTGLLWLAVAVAAIALLLGILSAAVVGRGISRPILAMTSAMKRLAAGDKALEIPAQGRRDEVGEMADAVQVFKENMIRAEQLAAEQEAERSARDARAKKVDALTRDFDRAVAAMLTQVGTATKEMEATASSMSATAEETNRQAGAVAAASEQASANVQTVASASEELASSIEEIGRQVAQSARIAGQATDDAQRTNAQVDGLAHAAQKIGEVVSLIQDIAEQTNLLALNATIEAARAGEAGKGFAVVASEVKNLANQTARATEQISQQISGVQTETAGAVAAIQGIGRTIGEINEIAASIASAVEEQGAATQEISRNVQEAAQGTQEVSSNIAGVTHAAASTGSAADQVNASARQLAQQSGELSKAVEDFLTQVRAA